MVMSANAQNVDIGFENDNQVYFTNDNMGLIHTPSYNNPNCIVFSNLTLKKKGYR